MTKTNVWKVIDKIITTALIVFVIVAGGMSLFFTINRMQNKLVYIFDYSICYVLTGSMDPAIKEGEVILIKKVDPTTIQVGDIITYQSTQGMLAGQNITHRVTAISNQGQLLFTTKGDANSAQDNEAVTVEKIKGVYQQKMPFVQFFVTAISNPIVFGLIVVLPIFIILILQLINVISAIKYPQDEEIEKIQDKKQ